MTTSGPGPGWFADPAGSGGQRFFDGTAWTEHVVPPPVPPPPAYATPPVPPPAPWPAVPGYGAWPGPAFGAWHAPWKGATLGRPQSGPVALAEPGRRLGAALLDGALYLGVLIVLSAIAIPIVAPHVGPLFPKTPVDSGPDYRPPFPGILWLYIVVLGCAFVTGLISIAYETIATVRYGRTLGKRWLGIRPVRTDGSPITTGRALARSAFRVAVGILNWIGLLDPLWCLWDDTRQCLHDKVADTIVINDPSPLGGASHPMGDESGPPYAAPSTPGAVAPSYGPGPAAPGYPTPGFAPPGATPPGTPAYWPNHGAWGPVSAVPTTNSLAIASLACSAGGLVFFGVPALPGIVLGFVSRRQIRRSGGTQAGAGLALGGIIVGFVVLALFAAAVALVVVVTPRSSSFYESAPPQGFVTHPLTHTVTALPAWLSSSDPEVDGNVNVPLEYRVVAALWTARQDALVRLDPPQMAVVDQPGSEALAADRALITLSAEGGQLAGPLRAQPKADWIAVPSSTTSYPLSLLGEVASPVSGGEQITLLVITKRSTTTPWRVSFTTDYSTKGSVPSYLLPTPGSTAVPFPPASVPGQLASYWQTWVDDHHAPVGSPFDPGYWTTTLGSQIGSRTSGALIHSSINSVSVRYRPAYGPWVFGGPGELPVVCTGIQATATYDATGAADLYQYPYRQQWGGLLAPGQYRHIVDTSVHPSCVLEESGSHLSVLGGDLSDLSSRGRGG